MTKEELEVENKKLVDDCRDSIGAKQEEVNKLNVKLKTAKEGLIDAIELARWMTGGNWAQSKQCPGLPRFQREIKRLEKVLKSIKVEPSSE